MKAKEYLKEIERIEAIIKNKREERERWRDIALHITGNYEGERVQATGNPQKMAVAAINNVDLEREIEEHILRLGRKKQEIIGVLEQLPLSDYELLYGIYVNKKTLNDMAEERGCSYSNITTLHGTALKKVQRIIDKKVETK
jgi:DNA-directed RNA polymerase specialized sigma subunit